MRKNKKHKAKSRPKVEGQKHRIKFMEEEKTSKSLR
jgi:hypothetical protein